MDKQQEKEKTPQNQARVEEVTGHFSNQTTLVDSWFAKSSQF